MSISWSMSNPNVRVLMFDSLSNGNGTKRNNALARRTRIATVLITRTASPMLHGIFASVIYNDGSMHLRNDESILKTVKRHKTPFVLKLFGIALMSIPVYFVLFIIMDQSEGAWPYFFLLAVSFFVGIIVALICFDYLLDKVHITNKRVIWVDWKTPFSREEHEAELLDIQDIETQEKGIISKIPLFDYGLIEIETAASKTCISYKDCPDPEFVKHFILLQIEKSHGGIHARRDTPPKREEWSVN